MVRQNRETVKLGMTTDVLIPKRIRRGVVLVLVLTVLLAIAATYFGANRLFRAQAASVAVSQHSLYLRALSEAIEQHQHLPFVIGKNPRVAEQLTRGSAASLNEMLEEFAIASQLEAIYVMTLDGTVVAASNHALPSSFLGQNYGFRPYFQQAISARVRITLPSVQRRGAQAILWPSRYTHPRATLLVLLP